jgi:hypothetical protein
MKCWQRKIALIVFDLLLRSNVRMTMSGWGEPQVACKGIEGFMLHNFTVGGGTGGFEAFPSRLLKKVSRLIELGVIH